MRSMVVMKKIVGLVVVLMLDLERNYRSCLDRNARFGRPCSTDMMK